MKENLYHIKTDDNVSIALWRLTPIGNSEKHIFLTHGAFSNRKICDGIATYLTDKGFNCWIMEWRNHGNSTHNEQKFNFETIAKYDIKSTFEFLFNNLKLKNIDCLTHSGGGIVLTMFLINNPDYTSKINSITLFGVQAFGAGTKLHNWIKILVSKYVSALLGKVYANMIGSSEDSESYYTMKQWFDWNLNKNFTGENNFNYLKKMDTIKIPIVSICAKGDTFIAPKIGCEKFLKAFDNDVNKLVFCSKKNGNLEDYSHSRIIKSQSSKKELWPIVEDWIKSQNYC